jgi:hypothetical protein
MIFLLNLLICPFSLNITYKKDTPLHIALRNSQVNIDAITLMINSCPNILSISNKEGLMPLHIACRHCPNRSAIIELIAKSYPRACICHIKVRTLFFQLNKKKDE